MGVGELANALPAPSGALVSAGADREAGDPVTSVLEAIRASMDADAAVIAELRDGEWSVSQVAGMVPPSGWMAGLEPALRGERPRAPILHTEALDLEDGTLVGAIAVLARRRTRTTATQRLTASAFAALLSHSYDDVWRQRELEARHAYDEKVRSDRSRLLAEVAHDFRTPLTVIGGLTDMLANDPGVQGRSRMGVRVIRANTHRLAALVDGLLDAETREAGDIREDPSVIDLASFMVDLGAEVEMLVSREEVEVVAEGSGEVTTQCEGLRRLLLNLAANAVRSTQVGMVSLTAEPIDGGARIIVADTGRGMSAQQLERYRQDFVRGDGSSGFGLGLSIVRRLATLLGVRVEITSEPDVGTRVELFIPDAG